MHELFPVDSMEYEQMLNSITRLVILLTIITLLFTISIRTIIIGDFRDFQEKFKIKSKKTKDKDTRNHFLYLEMMIDDIINKS